MKKFLQFVNQYGLRVSVIATPRGVRVTFEGNGGTDASVAIESVDLRILGDDALWDLHFQPMLLAFIEELKD